ncbi:glycosyltransferase [Urechidicola croceus]|uniref:Glycosyl transferase n=1 Tax=Urechidicola croceus TaxID=1850246 RepID=A0A1D8P9B9_9FLAO|nr:glycosyltransferase [Urechidicola croceus]AOW21170.1 hypothetical protein LPB138_10985 [Urechidicola croceus]
MNAVFTISTPNYIGYSISLFNSIKKHNKETPFYLVLFRPVEELDNLLIPKEINILYLDELGLEKSKNNFLNRYPVNKVCFAFKPIVAQKLLEKYSLEKVIYFDSDILVYNSLESIWNDLNTHNIVLTPHLVDPLENDDKERLGLRMLSRAGVFNAGFFAVKSSEEGYSFLNWWFKNLSKYGLLGDQLWLNFAPTHFKVNISYNQGYNVAYYNLPNRKIRYNIEENKYIVNDKDELVFFHFVQHNPFSFPEEISLARLKQPKLNFNNFPELKPIFNDYKNSLIEAQNSKFKHYKFISEKQSWFKKKFIHYKNQSIRALYKIIFEIVSI